MSLSADANVLAQWALWADRLQLRKGVTTKTGEGEARSLASNTFPVLPPWIPVSGLVKIFEAMSRAEAVHFDQLYSASKDRLSPLSDPLDLQFPLHRQLSASREEVYSDWLQWVLQQIAIADARMIGLILRSSTPERFAESSEPIEIEREVFVEHGHIDQTGRLDLAIRRGAEILAVIEVKTKPYSDWDREKHIGYRQSIASSETELIFLSVDPPASELFRYLSWAHVCIGLRAIAARILPQQVLTTALILAFIGAVEQNLLGFASPSLISIGKIPRVVDHLTEAVRMEETLGQ